jgi:hypothetical protein
MLQGRQASLWPLDDLREQLREVARLLLHYQTQLGIQLSTGCFQRWCKLQEGPQLDGWVFVCKPSEIGATLAERFKWKLRPK